MRPRVTDGGGGKDGNQRGDGLRPNGPLRVLLERRTPDLRWTVECAFGRMKGQQ